MVCKDGGVSYLLLILAQQECRHYTWTSDGKTINACNEIYEQFMKQREQCGQQFIQQLASSLEKKEKKE